MGRMVRMDKVDTNSKYNHEKKCAMVRMVRMTRMVKTVIMVRMDKVDTNSK